MAWVRNMVVFFAATLLIGNAQCATACAFAHCLPAAPAQSPCHEESTPDQGQPASAMCSHDISIVDTSATNITAPQAPALFAMYSAPLVAVTHRHAFHPVGDSDLSPPALSLLSTSVQRI